MRVDRMPDLSIWLIVFVPIGTRARDTTGAKFSSKAVVWSAAWVVHFAGKRKLLMSMHWQISKPPSAAIGHIARVWVPCYLQGPLLPLEPPPTRAL